MLWFKKKISKSVKAKIIDEKPLFHSFVIESLSHFNCGKCNKWWTISEFKLNQQHFINCPHCSALAKVVEKDYA